MESAASIKSRSAPSTQIKVAPVKITAEEIREAALRGVLSDFRRESHYRQRCAAIKAEGRDVHIISLSKSGRNANNNHHSSATGAAGSNGIVRQQSTVMLKDHRGVAGSLFFYQTGVFGLLAVSTAGSALLGYYGVTHSRMLLPYAAMGLVLSWRLWAMLEAAWEEKRYAEQAAHIREDRKGNPMHAVTKRRRREEITAEAEADADMDAADTETAAAAASGTGDSTGGMNDG